VHAHRDPIKRLLVGIAEHLRHDADDGPIDAVKTHLLADDVGPTEKAELPQLMAQDDDPTRSIVRRRVILLGEEASKQRLHTECGKGVSPDSLPAYAFW